MAVDFKGLIYCFYSTILEIINGPLLCMKYEFHHS